MIKEKLEDYMESSFAKSIIELKLASDRIVEGRGDGSGIFTVRYQILYLIASNKKTSPQDIIYELKMAKSNLALIAGKMIEDGLIFSQKEEGNRKQIFYYITEKGKKELATKMQAIDNMQTKESKEMIANLSKTVQSLKNVK